MTDPTLVTSVLIVDDHPMMRRGLAALIACDPKLHVCGEADNAEDALIAIEKLSPELVLVDIVLRGSNGLELIKTMQKQFPAVLAVVLSLHDELIYAERAFKAGARGYLHKSAMDERVASALHQVAEGEYYMSDAVRAHLACKQFRSETPAMELNTDKLSDRELEVFRHVGEAHTTRQIAKTLDISIKTVESHLENIKKKLDLADAAELAQQSAVWVQSNSS